MKKSYLRNYIRRNDLTGKISSINNYIMGQTPGQKCITGKKIPQEQIMYSDTNVWVQKNC